MPGSNATYVAIRNEQGELVKATESKLTSLNKKITEENAEALAFNAANPDQPQRELKPSVEPERAISVTKHSADTLAEAQTLVPDEKVLLTYFNRGYSLREEQAISQMLLDDEFTPVEGFYDLTEDLQKLPERTRGTRKAQTPDELVASLFDPAVLASLKASGKLNEVIEKFMAALGS